MEHGDSMIVYATKYAIHMDVHMYIRPLGRGVEHQFFGAYALYLIPLAEEGTFFRQLLLVLDMGNIECLGPVGGWG